MDPEGVLFWAAMKIRIDSVFVSSLLFTIALLCLIPASLRTVLTGNDKMWLAKLDAGYRSAAQTMSDLGIASLAVILIGLIIVWTGYLKRARSAWFVMLTIVWVWAFPLMIMPLFRARIALTFPEWLYAALSEPGSPRIWAESVLIFILMVIALFLPIKSSFFSKQVQEPIRRPSPRFVCFSAMCVLVILIALFAWIRVGVLYQIPLSELNSTQRLPSPPAPPTPSKTQ